MSAHRIYCISAAALLLAGTLCAQPAMPGRGGPPMSESMRQAQQLMRDGKLDEALAIYTKENANNQAGTVLDLQGKGADARKYFQKAIDWAADPLAKANAQRAM